MKKLIFVIWILTVMGGTAEATNYFNWNADSGSTSRGTCNFAQASPSAGAGHDGGGAILWNIPDGSDGQSGCNDLQSGSFGAGTWFTGKTFYFRWWMKFGTFNWGNRGHNKIIRLTQGGGSDLLTFYMDTNNINVESTNGSGCGGGVCGHVNYAFNGAAAKNWQEYVIALTLQTSGGGNGTVELFVNGASVGSFTHNLYTSASGDFSKATWGNAMLQVLYHQLCNGGSSCGSGGTFWTDDYTTDDVWNSNYGGGGAPPDTTPPTNPTGLTAQAAGSDSITLSWTASTDNTGVAAYQVDQCTGAGCSNFVQIGSSLTTSFNTNSVETLSPSTTYQFRVRAIDAAGNVSGNSNTASATTPAATATECSATWRTDHPSWIWCDDFEVDRISSYFDSSGQGGFVRASGIGFNNTWGMRATWTAAQVDAGSLKLSFGLVPSGAGMPPPSGVDTTTKFQEIYYRAYLKSQSNWVGQGANHNSKFTRATSFVAANWSQAMIAHLWSNDTGGNNNYLLIDPATCVTGSTVNCTGYNGSQLQYLGGVRGNIAIFTSPNAGNWNCIEAHVKLNTIGLSDGIQEFWVDGVLDASRTNLNFRGSYTGFGINAVLFENYINQGSSQAQSRWWDNIVVATQRIGCSNSPPVTLPAVPTGLRKIN